MPKVLPEYLEQRRKQILDAASECFYRNGFHQTTMNDICEAADLSPGAIYRYFHSKEDLIATICDEAHRRDLQLLASIQARGASPEVMIALGKTFFEALDPAEARLHIDMLAESPRSAHIHEVMRAGRDAIIGSFVDFIRGGQAAGDLNPDLDPTSVAEVLCALYHGFVVQNHIDPSIDPLRYTETVVALMSGGLFRTVGAAALSAGRQPERTVRPALTH
jgi:AcrR family transcriptional regulator